MCVEQIFEVVIIVILAFRDSCVIEVPILRDKTLIGFDVILATKPFIQVVNRHGVDRIR